MPRVAARRPIANACFSKVSERERQIPRLRVANKGEGDIVRSESIEAEALREAEEFVLHVARERHPSSLSELRTRVIEENEGHVDWSLLRVALWSLLNEHRLELTSDRKLRVDAP
jgi:hypothetical protein